MNTGCHALWQPLRWGMAGTPGVCEGTLEHSSLVGGIGRDHTRNKSGSVACSSLQSALFIFRVKDPSKCPLFHCVLFTSLHPA